VIALGLVEELGDTSLRSYYKVLNIYVPYVDSIPFWEGLSSSGVIIGDNIILGYNLNFTV